MDTIPQDNTPRKQCSNPDCLQWFPATPEFFHRNKQNKGGLCGQCKPCKLAYAKAYKASPEGQAKIQAYYNSPEGQAKLSASRKDYHSRPEVRERNRIRDRERHTRPNRQAWIQDYKSRPEVQEHIRDYMQTYRPIYYSQPENHAHKLQQDKHYFETHREQHRELGRIGQQRRRAKKRSISGTHTLAQIQEMLVRQRYKCYYCREKFKKVKGKYLYHIEHTFPIHRVAGTNIPANDISYLVLACPTCNYKKHDKFPWEWPEGGRLL